MRTWFLIRVLKRPPQGLQDSRPIAYWQGKIWTKVIVSAVCRSMVKSVVIVRWRQMKRWRPQMFSSFIILLFLWSTLLATRPIIWKCISNLKMFDIFYDCFEDFCDFMGFLRRIKELGLGMSNYYLYDLRHTVKSFWWFAGAFCFWGLPPIYHSMGLLPPLLCYGRSRGCLMCSPLRYSICYKFINSSTLFASDLNNIILSIIKDYSVVSFFAVFV